MYNNKNLMIEFNTTILYLFLIVEVLEKCFPGVRWTEMEGSVNQLYFTM